MHWVAVGDGETPEWDTAMHISSYLTASRHNVFYFRWPLPRSLHPYRKPS